MPNHCSNTLTVNGQPPDIEKFLTIVSTQDLKEPYSIIEHLFPIPADLKTVESGSSGQLGHEVLYGNEAVIAGILEYAWIKEANVTNREQLLEYFKQTRPNDLIAGEQYKHNIDTYSYPSWYEWCIKYWGTKWGDYDTELQQQSKRSLVFGFDSAWSPPEEAFNKIAANWPSLKFYLTYEELGMGFRGYARWENGEQTESHCEDTQDYADDEFEDDEEEVTSS